MEFGGVVVHKSEADTYRSQSIWPIDSEHYIGLPISDTEDSLDEFLNHSCDANVWLIDEVTLMAKRDITAGEEITLDQGTWNYEDATYTENNVPCNCGTSVCRTTLTPQDWQRPDVQERYRGHFHPLVQNLLHTQE
jgi:uncharacterized protein